MAEYWYNMRTGEVEEGRQSLPADLAGPFSTAEEAAGAPELMRRRAEEWAEEEAAEDD